MSFTSDNLYSLSSFTLFSFQGTTNIVSDAFASGGDEEDRTPDPLRARQVLSQLSYTPTLWLTTFQQRIILYLLCRSLSIFN